MSGIRTLPVEKTIALGGVATGSMKAKEHATHADIIKYRGCSPIEMACNQI